jgi:beta-glucosidase
LLPFSGKVADGATGAVADDSYHRYDEDAKLLANLGVQAYRMSLAWARLMHANGSVNAAGVAHYHRVLDALDKFGIRPLVTLYHWDLPLHLSVMQPGGDYQSWLNESIVPRFVDYARAAFDAYASRVKHWTTFNEPLTFCVQGYGSGTHAPGRCSDRARCAAGDSAVEPYLCTHSVLLAHAAAVDLYRTHYGGGQIGITLNTDWAQARTESPADQEAAERHLEWQAAWFADPIYFGDYPASMRKAVGARLPVFTAEQKKLLVNSTDFYGLNHCTL